MKISIIIVCKGLNPYLSECLKHCLDLDYPDFEIIVFPDEDFKYADQKVKIIATGKVTPPRKRNKALGIARGELFAFIDDDAYPRKDWLKEAVKYFNNPDVAAIGGPAITPPDDSLRQLASGFIYESPLASGGFTYRYRPEKTREVNDYPSCNFIVRREIFEELKGFKTNFWPGEDTFFCLEITKRLHKEIIYVPDLVVFHHRRTLFKTHLKQVSNYALHRGYFAKRFPETSLRLSYFVPSLFVVVLIFLCVTALFIPISRVLLILCGLFYILIILSAISLNLCNRSSNLRNQYLTRWNHSLKLILLIFSGIIFTHLTYGVYFIKGLFARKMREECES
jgi:GT2 family glycosyltransferase